MSTSTHTEGKKKVSALDEFLGQTKKREKRGKRKRNERKRYIVEKKKEKPKKKRPEEEETVMVSKSQFEQLTAGMLVDSIKKTVNNGETSVVTHYKADKGIKETNKIEQVIKMYDLFLEECLLPFLDQHPEHMEYFASYLEQMGEVVDT